MKLTKSVAFMFLMILALVTLESCKKCKNESPSARIINNGTADASVQIKTSEGNTVNINNVAAGSTSAYSNYAAGIITFTITVNKFNYVKTEQLNNCYEYDIIIGANNAITTTARDKND